MAYRQGNQVNANSPAVVAYDSDLLAGSTSIVGIRLSDNTVTISSVVGTGGAYSLLGSLEFTDASTQQRVAIYARFNVSAGPESITITASAVETTRAFIAEFSGRAASPLDQVNNSGFVAATTTVNSGNITTTEAGADLFGFLSMNASSVTFSGGSFTEQTETDGDRIGFMTLDNQAVGTYSFTGTLSGSDVHIAIVVSLKAIGGGGPTLPWLPRHTNLQGPKGSQMIPGGMTPPNRPN